MGNITSLKLIKKYNNIEDIIQQKEYNIDNNLYMERVLISRKLFNIFYNNINIDEILIEESTIDDNKLKDYLVNELEMNANKVVNSINKLNNKYII